MDVKQQVRRSVVFGSCIYIVTEGICFIIIGILYRSSFGGYWFSRLASILFWILKPFSQLILTITSIGNFSPYAHFLLPRVINLIGWILVAGFVVFKQAKGEDPLPVCLDFLKKLANRLKEVGFRIIIGLILLIMAAAIVFIVIYFSSPDTVMGKTGWAAFEVVFKGKAELSIFGNIAIFLAMVLTIFAGVIMWYSLSILIWGEDVGINYFCPYCRYQFDFDKPDPDAVFECPNCHKTIRRKDW